MAAGRDRPWDIVLAAVFIAASALEWLGPTWPSRPWMGAALLLAAVAALALSGRASHVARPPRAWPEALALLLAAVLAPFPGRWALLAAALCAPLGAALAGRRTWAAAVAARTALAFRAVVLVAIPVAAATALLAQLALAFQDVGALARPVAAALGLLGVRAAAFEGQLALTTLHGVANVPMTLSTLGLFPAAALWLGFLALRVVSGERPSPAEILRISLVVAGAAAGALILALLATLEYQVFLDFDYKETPAGFLAAPTFRMALLAVLAAPFLAASRPGDAARDPDADRPLGAWAATLPALALAAGLLLFVEEGGQRKAGRVMIDEAHSQWEAVEPSYDTDWYGFDSGYNYSVMARFLGRFYRVSLNRGEIDPEALDGVDVLIVKTPTRAYAPSEIDAIEGFVRRGGGLLLVGEHTNVWGSGFYLNALARRFGFRFRYDVVFDFRRKFEQVYDAPALAPHPILGPIRRFLFAVSCSILPRSLAARPVMWAGGLWSLDSDYAVSNFYPQADLDLDARVSPLAQCVSRHHGRGRIAGFTDSTIWSTFSAMLPGKPELLLGLVEWLNRRNRLPDTFPVGRVLLLLLVLMAAAVAWSRPRRSGFVIAGALAATLLGARAADVLNRRAYGAPQPHAPPEHVCFVADGSTYELPSWGFVRDYDRSYAIFYQWVQRMGAFPRVVEEGEPLPAGTRALVRIVGSGGVTPGGTLDLERALAGGIPVVLLLRSDTDTALAGWLGRHGLQLRAAPASSSSSLRLATEDVWWTVPWETRHLIAGGEPLLVGADGRTVLCRAGAAPLFVFLGGERFTDAWMGNEQGNIPDENLRRAFELEFALWRGLIHGDLQRQLREGATRPLAIRTTATANRAAPLDRPGGHAH